jgi:hypothetical protein
MSTQEKDTGPLPRHGARLLPTVEVDSYNLEIEDEEGYVGDRASKSSFAAILDKWRKPLRKLGEKPSNENSKKKLDSHLIEGDIDAAVVVHSAVEDFAQQLASVIRRFLKSKGWREMQCVAVGGGFRNSRVGELAIGRAAMLLKADELKVGLEPIHHDAVVQGLSELPFMGDFDRWGILTIGTGLGNARFTNRSKPCQKHGD